MLFAARGAALKAAQAGNRHPAVKIGDAYDNKSVDACACSAITNTCQANADLQAALDLQACNQTPIA